MSVINPTILTELIERAKDERFGLWVGTNNTGALVGKLSEMRTRLGADIMICTPSVENVVVLLQKSVDLQ